MSTLLRALSLPALIGLSHLAVADDVVTLKLVHFLPAISNVQVNIFEPWCKKISDESQGRMKCQIYPSLQLGGTAAQLVDLARNGVADIVWTAPGYSPGRFPKTEAIELPGMIPLGGTRGSEVVWNFYQQQLKDEYKDYKVLAMHADGGMNFHTRDQKIESAKDFEGLKLRAPNRTIASTLTALGAVPVAMPPAQVTEAISKGVVDGAAAVWENVVPTKISEVTKYHTDTPADRPALGATALTLLMNKRKYDSLPQDLKDVLDHNSGSTLVTQIGGVFDEQIERAKEKVLAENGTIVVMPLAAYDEAITKLKPLEAQWISNAKGFDGKAIIDAAHAMYPKN